MYSGDRLVGSRPRQNCEQFRQARLVRITRGAFTIGLDPFGMLDLQVVVDLAGARCRRGFGETWLGERFKCAAGRFLRKAGRSH